jgi:hypothetical protein
MKYISILALFLTHLSLSAQINDLLKDDNVVWIGEFTTNYALEAHQILDTSEYINTSKLLKYFNPSDDAFLDEDAPFESKICGYDNRLRLVYDDSTFTKKWRYYNSDSIEVIDSVTHEKKIKVSFINWNPLPPPRFYQARQILFYDKKKMNFGLRVLSISFIQNNHNESGEFIGLRNEGWIKPINIENKKINFDDPNILIVRRLKTNSNSPNIDNNIKVLKNSVGNINQKIIDDWASKKSIALYCGDGSMEKLSRGFKDTMLIELKQTLATKIPKDSLKPRIIKPVIEDAFPDFTRVRLNTNETKVPIDVQPSFISDTSSTKNSEQNVADAFPEFINLGSNPRFYSHSQFLATDSLRVNGIQEISKIRIVQDWYWDEKLKNICIRLYAVAPLIKVYNETGEFIFYTSLFYRMND